MSDSSSSSYGGSGASISEEETPLQAVVDQIQAAFDPLPLHRAQVAQAQLSGVLRSQSAELEDARRQLNDELRVSTEKLVHARKLARKVRENLVWLDKHVGRLEQRAKVSWPIEFEEAQAKVEGNLR